MKRVLIFSLAVLLPLAAAFAQSGSWAADASGNWSAAGNWIGGVVATGTDSTAWFTNAITAGRTVTNDLSGQLIGNLFFAPVGANGWSLNGSSLSFSTAAGQSLLYVAPGGVSVGAALSGTGTVVKDGA